VFCGRGAALLVSAAAEGFPEIHVPGERKQEELLLVRSSILVVYSHSSW
jgi:hypothetical protein